jgi:hypothetical protein
VFVADGLEFVQWCGAVRAFDEVVDFGGGLAAPASWLIEQELGALCSPGSCTSSGPACWVIGAAARALNGAAAAFGAEFGERGHEKTGSVAG